MRQVDLRRCADARVSCPHLAGAAVVAAAVATAGVAAPGLLAGEILLLEASHSAAVGPLVARILAERADGAAAACPVAAAAAAVVAAVVAAVGAAVAAAAAAAAAFALLAPPLAFAFAFKARLTFNGVDFLHVVVGGRGGLGRGDAVLRAAVPHALVGLVARAHLLQAHHVHQPVHVLWLNGKHLAGDVIAHLDVLGPARRLASDLLVGREVGPNVMASVAPRAEVGDDGPHDDVVRVLGQVEVGNGVPDTVGDHDVVGVVRADLAGELPAEGVLRRKGCGQTKHVVLRRLRLRLSHGRNVLDRVLPGAEGGKAGQEDLAEVRPVLAEAVLVVAASLTTEIEIPLPGGASEMADGLADGRGVADAVLAKQIVH